MSLNPVDFKTMLKLLHIFETALKMLQSKKVI